MWRKSFALSLLLCLPLCFLSAQGLSSGDMAILENQQVILSILPELTASLNSREADLSKKDELSIKREQALSAREQSLKAREDLTTAKEAELSQTEMQLQKLKSDVATVSESLKKERESGVLKNRALVVMAGILAGSIIYGILK